MSGHSKWATIKRKKAVIDASRGKIFTQVVKEITVAAKNGGGNPDMNPHLRLAIEKAKSVNMPQDNIKRAIMKVTGELPGVSYEEIIYEGYASGGVAIIVECLTDNKTRTVSEIRHLFERHNGKMGTAGTVAWMFHKKGKIIVKNINCNEDDVINIALENGADDIETIDNIFEVTTSVENFENVLNYLNKKFEIENSQISMVPENLVKVEGKDAISVLKLMEVFEEHDDVQNVYANFDIDEKTIEEYNK